MTWVPSSRDDLHGSLVPVAKRYLRQLDAMLARAGLHANESGMAEEDLLDWRLRTDMLTLRMQVRIAMEFPFRALDQVLDAPSPRTDVDTASMASLRRSLGERIEALDRIDPGNWRDVDDLILRDRAGEADVEAPVADFISLYVLPNFFFHVTAVYMTCRLLGVPLGKGDFDRFHVYPEARPTA